MHLYSNNLSTIALSSWLIKSELLPACFSCNNHLNLLQNSSGFSDKNFVVTTQAIIAGNLSSLKEFYLCHFFVLSV